MLRIEKGIFDIQKKKKKHSFSRKFRQQGVTKQSGRLQFRAVETSLEILTACAIKAVRQWTSVSVQKQPWETATDSVLAAI